MTHSAILPIVESGSNASISIFGRKGQGDFETDLFRDA